MSQFKTFVLPSESYATSEGALNAVLTTIIMISCPIIMGGEWQRVTDENKANSALARHCEAAVASQIGAHFSCAFSWMLMSDRLEGDCPPIVFEFYGFWVSSFEV